MVSLWASLGVIVPQGSSACPALVASFGWTCKKNVIGVRWGLNLSTVS